MKAQKPKTHLIKIDSESYALLNAYQAAIVKDSGMKPTYSQMINAVFTLYMKEHKNR